MRHLPGHHIIGDSIVSDLENEIANLQDDFVWAQDARVRKSLRKKMKNRNNAIRLVQAVIDGLPENLEFFSFEAQEPHENAIIKARFDFNLDDRYVFLRDVFRDAANHDNLQTMGISEREIERCAESGRAPMIKPGIPSDFSVDHTVDIRYGGTNGRENLFILPGYVNELKARFTNIQNHLGRTDILSFRPRMDRHGERPLVPIIPLGFQVLTINRDTIKRRMETLLDADLK